MPASSPPRSPPEPRTDRGVTLVTDLLVLGGSGSTGVHVLEQAAQRGHRVRALVRDPDSVQPAAGDSRVAATKRIRLV
ncbi:NAD(P)H-binding protein [Streptomyces sp. MnatMP-M27]|uniref:NAD(P)H-binding protein n=1 Tax=Streptomyces sp. MnatMP-M27 TaxID=1839768 RepID=UPI00351E46EC